MSERQIGRKEVFSINQIYVMLLLLAFALVILEILSKKRKRRIKNTSLLNKIEETSRHKYIKWMHDKPQSKRHKALQKKIREAGLSISPEAMQLISYFLPLIMFFFLLAIRYTNIINAMMNIEQLKKIAESIGDSNIANVNTKINWAVLMGVAFVFIYLPNGVLKVLGAFRQAVAQKEVVMLQTYAIMMLKTGKSVKQILVTMMDRSKTFKPILEKAVNNYSQNPQFCLKDLKDNCGNKDFEKIVTSLEQALRSDRKISLKYLENHRVLGKELHKINNRERNAKKNVFGILLMIVPLIAMVLVGGYPWFVLSMKILQDVPI
jgi:hypothetical protein